MTSWNDFTPLGPQGPAPVAQPPPGQGWEQFTPAPRRGVAEDMARSIPPMISGGISTALGFPVDTINMLLGGSAWLTNRVTGRNDAPYQIPVGRGVDYRAGIDSGVRSVVGDDVSNYRPQTLPGRMVQQAGEFAIPAMLAPGVGMARGMATLPGMLRLGRNWGAAGAAQEAAGTGAREMGLPPEIEASIRAAIAASLGIGLSMPMARQQNASRIARENLDGVTPQEIEQAQRLQRTSQDIGVPLVGGEALGFPGQRVQQLASDVMRTPQGRELTAAMGRRQGQVQQAVEGFTGQIAPGPLPPAANIVDEVSRGARNVIQDARARRTMATSPDYRAAALDPVDPALLRPLLRELDQHIAEAGANNALGRALTDYRNRVAPPAAPGPTPGAATPPPGAMPMVGPLAQTYRETARGIYPAPSAAPQTGLPGLLGTQERGVIGPVNTQLRDILEATNPTFARAQETYRRMSPPIEELRSPGLFGGLQRALPETGSVPAALQRQMGAIAPTNPTMTTPQTIARLFGEMANPNRTPAYPPTPLALPRLARQGLESEMHSALNAGGLGVTAPTVGARFALQTAGREGSRRAEGNWQAVMAGIERSQNLPEGQLQTGFQNLIDVLRRTGQIPGAGSPTHGRMATAREASRSPGAAALETTNLSRGSIFGTAADAMRNMANRGAYRILDRVLADPNNIDRLLELARLPVGSTRFQRIAATIINTGSAVQGGLDRQGEQP